MKKSILIVVALGVISSIKAFSQKVDTVQVMMFYCDTTRIGGGIWKYTSYKFDSIDARNGQHKLISNHKWGECENCIPYVYWRYGYNVYKLHNRNEGLLINYKKEDDLIQVLDADKKPLPKNIVVFQTIQL